MRADAPAVKIQYASSSQSRASDPIRQTSSNSASRARISFRRALCAARMRSTVTGLRSSALAFNNGILGAQFYHCQRNHVGSSGLRCYEISVVLCAPVVNIFSKNILYGETENTERLKLGHYHAGSKKPNRVAISRSLVLEQLARGSGALRPDCSRGSKPFKSLFSLWLSRACSLVMFLRHSRFTKT